MQLVLFTSNRRKGRAEINGHSKTSNTKKSTVSNTHAPVQHAHKGRHLPHVAHTHVWKIKERNRKTANQHYQENIPHSRPDVSLTRVSTLLRTHSTAEEMGYLNPNPNGSSRWRFITFYEI